MTNDLSNLYYLSIDPGQRTTGWAAFDRTGSELAFDDISGGPDKFMDWLESLDPQPREIIYEGYAISPTINHGFSEAVTIQLIGMIKRHANKHKIELHKQRNTELKVALRMVGFYSMYYDARGKKKKHVDDKVSAYAHGVYFLTKRGIRKSRLAR
jgi:hypothetical protein